MAQTTVKKGSKIAQKVVKEPVKPLYIILLIAYGFVTVLTPNLNTLDSNGPKFMTLSFLNLLTFIFLFTGKDLKTNPGLYKGFFGNAIGAVYASLMLVSLLSFFNAFNKIEALLHFAKIFTTFSAAYLISILILSERRGLLWLSVAMTLLLAYDCITVFSDIQAYIAQKGINNIASIKSSYSNKNILASAVFVKIPFALWLMVSQKKYLRLLGGCAVFISMLGVFFMSARAFYLGLFGLTGLMTIYYLVRYYQTREKSELKILAAFVAALIVSLGLFTLIEKNLYPKESVSYSSVGGRLSTITEPGGGNRLAGWVRSWHVFKEKPILGVGLGNWKIATLKEENFTKGDYTYQYKAHNDFIETATETGIIGGLLLLSIFILTGWKALKLLFTFKSEQALSDFFLPAVGLFCYSFDAFFNFPQDRPEIQALFALYAGIVIALTSRGFIALQGKYQVNESDKYLRMEIPFLKKRIYGSSENIAGNKTRGAISGWIFPSIFLVALIGSSYFLILNFKSLKLQRIIKQEINTGKLTSKADQFLKGFPFLPNLNVVGEPIAAQKARYLINEKRYNEAISILKNDHSSPYDTRPEYFLAMAYFEKKMPDSSMYYSNKVYEMKPDHFKNISILTNTMQQQGKSAEAEIIIDKYLERHKTDLNQQNLVQSYKEAVLFASSFYDKTGKLQKALDLINSGSLWFPSDTNVIKQKTYLQRKVVLAANKESVDAALNAFRDKKYQEAVGFLNKLISAYPAYSEAREYRAFSYFFLKEYTKSNEDLDQLIANGSTRPNLFNLRGVNYFNLGKLDEACKNFKIARDKGDKDGLTNYNRFCGQQK